MKTIPNQGIKLSIRNAVGGGGRVGLIFGLIPGLISGLISGLIFGLSGALWYGGLDVIQHYILRFILHRKGYLPWKLVPFLDYAAENLNFLQKVGGGYLFIHRYLLEHFAAMGEEVEEKSTTPAPAQRPSMSS